MNSTLTFDRLVTLCQQTHAEIQTRALRSVDVSLVIRNWLFGRYILEFEQQGVDRAAYGTGLVDSLAARLRLSGIKGVSPTRLRLYRSFYRVFSVIHPTLPDESVTADPLEWIQPTLSAELTGLSSEAATLDALFQVLPRRFTLAWSHYVELLTIDNPDERRNE